MDEAEEREEVEEALLSVEESVEDCALLSVEEFALLSVEEFALLSAGALLSVEEFALLSAGALLSVEDCTEDALLAEDDGWELKDELCEEPEDAEEGNDPGGA